MAKLLLSLFTMAFLVSSAHAEATNQKINVITITIDNSLGIDLMNARFNLNATDDWTDIGVISIGKNIYKVEGEPTDSLSILQAMEPNGQWMSAVVEKLDPNTIDIKIGRDDREDAAQFWTTETKKDSVPATIVSTLDGSTRPDVFFPRDKRYRYEWPATCAAGTIGVGVIHCDIEANPRLNFNGWGGGIGVFAGVIGGWASDLTREQLRGRNDTFRIWAFFYVSITMGSHSRFGGGGQLAFGFTGGDAQIRGAETAPPVRPPSGLSGVMIENIRFRGQCIAQSNNHTQLILRNCNANDKYQRWHHATSGPDRGRIFGEARTQLGNRVCLGADQGGYSPTSRPYTLNVFLSTCGSDPAAQNGWYQSWSEIRYQPTRLMDNFILFPRAPTLLGVGSAHYVNQVAPGSGTDWSLRN